ncbi:MAG TPA: hypothetical protein VLA05_10345 [Coriobacteriia bacterium]|nr:hypothetical protein [Coriobacteriia bacterium]
MKGTRLWQNTGSALISGYSRRQKPFWRDWLVAAAVGFVVASVGFVLWGMLQGSDPSSAARVAWVPAFIGCTVGAVPGVWIAGKFGLVRRWPTGAICGVVLSLGTAWLLAVYLLGRLNG